MTLDFGEIFHINNTGEVASALSFYDHLLWLNKPSNPTPGWQDVTVSGVNYINLTNAKANSLEYLKLFGGTEQRNLSSEYTQVNYVTNTAKTWLNTGVKFDFSKNYEIELRVRGTLSSWYIFQARGGGAAQIHGISGSLNNNTITLSFLGSSISSSQITRISGNIYYIKGIINNGTLTLYIKDETAGIEETVTDTYTVGTGQSVNIGLLGNGVPTQSVEINSDVYFARIKEDGNYILNYVPCKQSTTAGFYDKVTNTFKTTTDLSVGSDVVPSPDTPMDIVCNNGVIKVRSKSGLPDGYIKLKYLESDGNSYINTGIYANTSTSTFHCGLTPILIDGTLGVFGSRTRQTAADQSCNVFIASSSFRLDWTYGAATAPVPITANTYYDIECSRPTCTINGVQYTSTTTVSSSQTYPFYIGNFANAENAPYATGFVGYIHFGKLYTGNSLVFNGIPCRRKSDNVLGMYDTVTNTFFTNAGTGIFTAGDIDYDDYEIYADGTVETVEIDTTGDTATAENLFKIDTYQDVQSVVDGEVTRNIGIKVLDGTETITVLSSASYPLGYYFSLESSDIDHVPGVSGVKIPAYCTHLKEVANSASYLTNGTFCVAIASNRFYIAVNVGANVDAFKQFLADQYANGTPVIIVYPLATSVTETVTSQPMNIQAGTNIIEITQASLDDLKLEASYKAGVVVTITEAQNTNLSNQVTVTIGD